MQGLLYLMGNVAICVVIMWAMMNDHVPITGKTAGMLAMPDPADRAQPARKGRGGVRPERLPQ